jgi:hypothetical protein
MRSYSVGLFSALLGIASVSPGPTPGFAQSCVCPSVPAYDPDVILDNGTPLHSSVIVAGDPPPPLPVYDQPPIPGPGYIWTPGYWSWNGDEHYWVPGVWVLPPRPGLLWTPGYWGFANGAYGFHRGYWGVSVGFYGGISYGFGYGGVGFEGGHWDNGQFFYNKSVTNIQNVSITNVYDSPVTNNTTVNHTSFNGGPNGVVAQPTATEIAASKQQRVAPTPAQATNVRAASHTESAFASINNGKPTVAATAKPGELKGAAVVPAKAVGGPMPVPSAAGPAATPEAKPAPGLKPAQAVKPAEKLEPSAQTQPTNPVEPDQRPTKSEPTKSLEPKTGATQQPKLQAAPKTPAIPKNKPEKKPDAKRQAKPDSKPEVRPAAKPETTKPEIRSEPTSAPKVGSGPKPEPPKVTSRPPAAKRVCGEKGQPACPR